EVGTVCNVRASGAGAGCHAGDVYSLERGREPDSDRTQGGERGGGETMRLRRFLALSGAAAGGVYWLARYLRPQHSALILTDKVVLITGVSTGIGRALAFAFARRGARVALIARNEERLEAVRREIEPYSAEVLVVPADLTDEA